MTQVKAIRFQATGGPEVLEVVHVDLPDPGPGEVRVRHRAIGVNFIDTYHRRGLYPVATPCVPGVEAAGVVEAVGPGVTRLSPGDRVVYFCDTPGSYAEARVLPERWVVPLPEPIDFAEAAAGWLKACTAEFLVERCVRAQPGQWVVVTAAAGGMGLLLCRWLAEVGAVAIAVASTAEKRARALAAGAAHALAYDDWAADVRRLTDGCGAHAVIDGVGRTTFHPALDALRRRGLLVSFGNASGPVGPVDLGILARKGSLFTTRPTLFDYYAEPQEFAAGTARVLSMWPKLQVQVGARRPLDAAAAVHAELEARQTSGSTVLEP
ncbi:MAG: quinone oxidoreductase [Sphingomonadaceae bacterium]|uniref:quinone oxidoreductase family protein n=1 Tax=Thermaurantiacus sp. TaxID=2820283 RepID=UPI00298EF24C|nr:quinone oxidoreductase [Thermaurantiacus sp.]MCS6987251.1 quinone oxidoreductase [Sphingomonadaceae bacterium]MDW8414471.1 quinone oxidoreductase [Thermaurantiacus sp.]